MALRLSYVKTLWGVQAHQGNAPGGYSGLFAKLKADGFHAVETPIWMVEDKPAFCAALKEHGMGYVAMVNTCTPPGDHNGTKDLALHLASFKRQVAEALALDLRPLLINSHSGCDAWNSATAAAYFEAALFHETEVGITVCHETHRGRVLYNPWATRDLCRQFPALKLTADLSHFCVVAERVFAADDEDWFNPFAIVVMNECLLEFAKHTKHIHARVGYAQGPQVNHPRAPENRVALERHEAWWDQILATQAAAGVTHMTVEPEHGTDGYQQRLPFTNIETADIWEVNSWLRAHEAERMAKLPFVLHN